ncbi:2-polyprenyl-3-methyl-5-hydroxy-6-metoxy-1,4-benzoquinol methylase [Caldalkalibacillus uzonensis]|uniref:2-polyprenyl-3-methyl-5-hydroxy-6-metoxy-1, 4-benzoquinol methylase n=1 Tax=Caldalkalibacillus uzonensis TaxID=353224 RepID=A0ABU0CV13_9BACI|nr:methyltransferase domain-containing protein [Caldalkalibacillus uzonensis]MDQ0340169.1 2-polyprenyl-3-methyl-5-hydroxy-6-metoxy-1,4-benzoquinol methylase [Caldalkalibacillus uzonensis]
MGLNYTGERVIPELMNPMNSLLLEHLARYSFAIPYLRGRVLDIACGSGYGAFMMAKVRRKSIKELVAVDYDHQTIEYALKQYHHPLINYRQEDALDPALPDKLGLFDTIISFETLEHLPDDRQFMHQLYHMLKPGGTLVLSTPFGQGRGKPCRTPFHVHQLTQGEFIELFTPFADVQYYLQTGVAIERAEEESGRLLTCRPGVRYAIGIAVAVK